MTQKVERILTGIVVSSLRDKTITVLIQRQLKHKVYKKYIKRSNKVHAHDENNKCTLGDWVRVKEVAPYSKTKHWQLVEIIEKAKDVN